MKKTVVICFIVCTLVLLAVVGTVYAINSTTTGEIVSSIAEESYASGDERLSGGDSKRTGIKPQVDVTFYDDKGNELPTYGPMYYNQLFQYGCRNATAEQKIKLVGQDVESLEGRTLEWYPRNFMTAFGYLPEDTPRLTEAMAREIITDVQAEYGKPLSRVGLLELALRFNDVAGAPDFCGGSGVYRAKYVLDKVDGGADEVWIEETSVSFITNGEEFLRERIR